MLTYLQDCAVPSNLHQCHVMSTILDDVFEKIARIFRYFTKMLWRCNHEAAMKWTGAIFEELETHKKKQTWCIVPLPRNCKSIKSKLVFKMKRKSDGIRNFIKSQWLQILLSMSWHSPIHFYQLYFSKQCEYYSLYSLFL